jgi:hypothetical protein
MEKNNSPKKSQTTIPFNGTDPSNLFAPISRQLEQNFYYSGPLTTRNVTLKNLLD